jgi:predicted alpha-1,6-mannanase (GH76 family)
MSPEWPAEPAYDPYAALVEHFWDARRALFRTSVDPGRGHRRPWRAVGPWHYWWQAHALDAASTAGDRERCAALVAGILRRNGGTVRNNYFDDLAWLGLALHRGAERLDLPVRPLLADLWAQLCDGYDARRGAMAWRRVKGRPEEYYNAATNGPTAILAAALGHTDLAGRLVDWLHTTLVADRRVFDGIRGDGTLVRDSFTYNHGVVVGADLAMYAATGDQAFRDRAHALARGAARSLADPHTGLLPDEGGGDGGLFKGILVRYLADLLRVDEDPEVERLLMHNAAAARANSRGGLVGPDWGRPPAGRVELSVQLSGVLLSQAAGSRHG